jgi:F-type H+-transporting ATPase subunit epsilon
MPDLIQLEVATPERLVVREDVDSVQVPGKDGYLGILPGHAPLVGQLGTGYLSYGAGGRRRYLSVSGGFLQVLPDHVRVLANIAERAEEIDVERAKAELNDALEGLSTISPDTDPEKAVLAEQLARARVDAAEQR